jgi:polysaccharide deacetylase family protein (PEP-CTERM system associated)
MRAANGVTIKAESLLDREKRRECYHVQNALTIDLEDWYHAPKSTSRQPERWSTFEDRVVDPTHRLLTILEQGGVRATFFVLGYIADRFPDLVRRVADAGHEIGLHGYHHRQVFHLTRDQFRAELLRGREAVESAGGQKVIGHRAPMFSINGSALWALEELQDLGFRYDSSVFPTRNMLYGYPGAPRFPYHPLHASDFVEFPMSTIRVAGVNVPVAGGFYLRFYPYRATRWALSRLNRAGHPAIVYLHPWELDPGHPRPSLTLREQFTHYYRLDRTEARLRKLLHDFRFCALADLWNHTVQEPPATSPQDDQRIIRSSTREAQGMGYGSL